MIVVVRRVHHEHHHVAPQVQRLQAQFPLSSAPVFPGDRVSRENDLDANKVKPMRFQISQPLGFVIGEHDFIVDSNKCNATTLKVDSAKQPLIEIDCMSERWTAKKPDLTIPQSLLRRADEVIE